MAEAIFKDYVEKNCNRNLWAVDSAGISGFQFGENVNDKAMSILIKNGITNYRHSARLVSSLKV